MDNTKLAMNLLRYVDSEYPLSYLRKAEFRIQSARRWGIFEYVSSLLDNQKNDPIMLIEVQIGRLACMISHMLSADKDSMVVPYEEALEALIAVEEKLTNGAFK